MMFEELGQRERQVLRVVVEEYITTGGPVGSAQLLRKADLDVSSATVRNVMAELEDLGFLEKPHTSAGRVPTDRGYRFYVDTLVPLREPIRKERELIEQGLLSEGGIEEVLQETSKILHFLTRHAGVVLVPKTSSAVFRRIDFIKLGEGRVLAILVGHKGHVQSKAFVVDFPVDNDELVRASSYLNELLKESPLEEVRGRILSELAHERALYDALASKALKLARAATDVSTSERVLIEGTVSFLDTPEFSDIERMRALFRALEEKHKLLELLDRVQRAKEMQIFIGGESEFSSAGDVTVVACPYGAPDNVLGTVGVIGPTRMHYERVISLVSFTAQVLSKVLQ